MIIGRKLVESLLNGGDFRLVLDAGLNRNWVEGNNTGADAVFTALDKRAFLYLLKFYSRHHHMPDMETFRQHYPEEELKFEGSVIPVPELVELIEEKVNSFLVADVIGRAIDLHDQGRINQALTLLNMDTGIKHRTSQADDISSKSFDIEKLLNFEMEPGIPFGIKEIDDEFYGFQPGQLITLMGRQKSGKSWSTVNSALNAWRAGYNVLLFSVEMDVDVFHQRVLSLGAHVSYGRMRRGRLSDTAKEKVRVFHSQLTEEEGRFLVSKKKASITVEDIKEEVRLYQPNIVYIDGFSFMVDSKSGKLTSDWQANENVAYALKELAMEEQITVFVNTQVQEKQYSPKHGIEARTIAAGTGLLKASDLVLGQDKEDDCITINCIYSRYEYTPTVVIEVDWDNMEFISVHEKLEEKGV